MTIAQRAANADGAATYTSKCYHCGISFDAMAAAWCYCVIKERSLVCPSCGHCFCQADLAYKRNFWMYAPDALWHRKQSTAHAATQPPPNPASPAEARRPLVLVVDDDREIVAVAAQLIAGWGFGCLHAYSAAEALALAHEFHPDVIVTDALMPKTDGRELCRVVKSTPALAATRVVIMSSVYTSGRFRREAISNFNADDYVAKPIDAERLYKLVAPGVARIEASNPRVPSADAVDPGGPFLTIASEIPAATVPPEPVIEADPAPEPFTLPRTPDELVRLCAVGLDEETVALLARHHGRSLTDVMALRFAGIRAEFLDELDPEISGKLAVSDLVLLHGSGVDAETVNTLSRLGYAVGDIARLLSAGVPPSFTEALANCSARLLTSAEIIRLHCAKVGVAYIRALCVAGYAGAPVQDWIRLSAAGVTPEFIETANRVLLQQPSPADLIRLWLTGVAPAVLGRFAPA